MTHRSTGWRFWRNALMALVLPLALGACGDDDDDPTDPGPPAENGTWAFVEDGRTSYVRVTDDEIQIFESAGACYLTFAFEIVERNGTTFTVDDGVSGAVDWDVRRVGANLVVENEDGVSTTLTPSTANTSGLTMCEPFDPEVDDFARPACSSLPQLAVPGSVEGDLGPGDARFYDDTWMDLYRITLTEETDVSITMAADNQDNLDAYLSIYDASGSEIVDDDDAADGSDSRAEATLGPGCYYVVAGSWQGAEPGETGGGYTLTADTEFVFVFPPAACEDLPEVTVGGSVTDELVEGDLRWSDDTWYDAYSLQLDTEQTVTISQIAEDTDLLDPYLLLYDADAVVGEDIAENDDIDYDGGNYNSQIADITLAPGCYVIVAGTWMGDDEGEVGGTYTLSVE